MTKSFAIALMVLSILVAVVMTYSLGVYGIVAAGCFCYVMTLCGGVVGSGKDSGRPALRWGRSLASHYEAKAKKADDEPPPDPKVLRFWKIVLVIFSLCLIALGFLTGYRISRETHAANLEKLTE